jgi:hypothetical protein
VFYPYPNMRFRLVFPLLLLRQRLVLFPLYHVSGSLPHSIHTCTYIPAVRVYPLVFPFFHQILQLLTVIYFRAGYPLFRYYLHVTHS